MARRKVPLSTPETANVISNETVTCDIADIKQKLKDFKFELINEINQQTNTFQSDIEKLITMKQEKSSGIKGTENRPKTRQKVFKHRESILTDLFQISHIRTIRRIFISILIIACVQFMIYDFTNDGKLNLDFELFFYLFDGFLTTMLFIWLPMKLFVMFTTYGFISLYNTKRKSIKSFRTLFDWLFAVSYVVYISFLSIVPLFYLANISIACRIIVLMEQVRLLMKTHAFVRTVVPQIKGNIDNCENEAESLKKEKFPSFQKFVYFLFAPTLVYRNTYPKTTGPVKWKTVIYHFFEVFGCMIYTYCLFDRFCVPVFRKLKIREMGLLNYIELVSICVLPGALIQIMVFCSFLHSWHNAWAEMLSFGDRQFYLDWWNSTSFNEYYRTWNTLVHDWLYNYVYNDLYTVFGKKYKMFAQFGVIFLSGLVHEYILTFTFGFFYPVMFVMFAIVGYAVLFVPKRILNDGAWNILFWVSLFTGIGIEISFLAVEYYARQNNQCPRNIETTADYFIPRSLLCAS